MLAQELIFLPLLPLRLDNDLKHDFVTKKEHSMQQNEDCLNAVGVTGGHTADSLSATEHLSHDIWWEPPFDIHERSLCDPRQGMTECKDSCRKTIWWISQNNICRMAAGGRPFSLLFSPLLSTFQVGYFILLGLADQSVGWLHRDLTIASFSGHFPPRSNWIYVWTPFFLLFSVPFKSFYPAFVFFSFIS